MANDIEHLFMCLCATRRFSLIKCLKKVKCLKFIFWVLCVFNVEFEWFFIYCRYKVLCFSRPVICCFFLLTGSFAEQKFLNSHKVQPIEFSFYGLWFCVMSKTSLSSPRSWNFLMSFYRSFIILWFTLQNICFVILYGVMFRSRFIFLPTNECPISSALLLKRQFLFHWIGFASLSTISWQTCMDLFLSYP